MLLCFRQLILILRVNVRFITFCYDVLLSKKIKEVQQITTHPVIGSGNVPVCAPLSICQTHRWAAQSRAEQSRELLEKTQM